MKQKSPYIRYFNLVKWMSDKHYPSMADMIAWFEEKGIMITDRTFYRDRKTLIEMYNIPIVYCKINKGYIIDTDSETHHETNRFLQLMQEMITANAVSGMFSDNSKYLTYLEFENQPDPMFQDVFEDLLAATQKRLKIKFQYSSYQKTQPVGYQVKPLFLKQYQNRWYIIVQHHQKYKAFALERIKNLETTNNKFTASLETAKQIYTQVIGLTNDENKKIEEVKLRFHPSQKNYIKSVYIHKSQQEITDNNQEYTIKFYVKPNFELKQQILKYGALVEVLKPPKLRTEIKQEHQKALKLYKENRE